MGAGLEPNEDKLWDVNGFKTYIFVFFLPGVSERRRRTEPGSHQDDWRPAE